MVPVMIAVQRLALRWRYATVPEATRPWGILSTLMGRHSLSLPQSTEIPSVVRIDPLRSNQQSAWLLGSLKVSPASSSTSAMHGCNVHHRPLSDRV